jgi:hypothetical protein
MMENLELLGSLPVVSGAQDLVGYFSVGPNHLLQGESMSIQLLGKVQQLLLIDGVRGLAAGQPVVATVPRNAATGGGLSGAWEGTSFGFHAWLLSLTQPEVVMTRRRLQK